MIFKLNKYINRKRKKLYFKQTDNVYFYKILSLLKHDLNAVKRFKCTSETGNFCQRYPLLLFSTLITTAVTLGSSS